MIPSPYNLALFGWLVVFCLFQIGSHYACLVGLEFLPYSSGCPPTYRHLLASRCGSLCLVAGFDREKKICISSGERCYATAERVNTVSELASEYLLAGVVN